MNITGIVSELKAERNRIDDAIAALEGLSGNGVARRVRRQVIPARKRGHLSTQGRRRLSELMKKRWAERRKKMAAKS